MLLWKQYSMVLYSKLLKPGQNVVICQTKIIDVKIVKWCLDGWEIQFSTHLNKYMCCIYFIFYTLTIAQCTFRTQNICVINSFCSFFLHQRWPATPAPAPALSFQPLAVLYYANISPSDQWNVQILIFNSDIVKIQHITLPWREHGAASGYVKHCFLFLLFQGNIL